MKIKFTKIWKKNTNKHLNCIGTVCLYLKFYKIQYVIQFKITKKHLDFSTGSLWPGLMRIQIHFIRIRIYSQFFYIISESGSATLLVRDPPDGSDLILERDDPGLHNLQGEVGHRLGHRVLQLRQRWAHLNKRPHKIFSLSVHFERWDRSRDYVAIFYATQWSSYYRAIFNIF